MSKTEAERVQLLVWHPKKFSNPPHVLIWSNERWLLEFLGMGEFRDGKTDTAALMFQTRVSQRTMQDKNTLHRQ